MTQSQSDLYGINQKNLYPHKDFRPIVSPDSTFRKPDNPYPHPTFYSKSRLFIVAWQLPCVEYHDINNFNS